MMARAAALGLLVALLAGCVMPAVTHPSPSPAHAGRAPSEAAALERRIHDLVNGHRAARGLPPLAYDERVATIAREHSARMAASGRLGHEGFEGRVAAARAFLPLAAAAENVAYDGRSPPADRIVQGWIGSAGHRRNIEGAYSLTGIGVVRTATGVHYATQIFLSSR